MNPYTAINFTLREDPLAAVITTSAGNHRYVVTLVPELNRQAGEVLTGGRYVRVETLVKEQDVQRLWVT